MRFNSVICWLFCTAVIFSVVGHGKGSPGTSEPPQCAGKCVPIDSPCETTSGIDSCGIDSKCCLDTDAFNVPTEEPESYATSNPELEMELRFRSFLEDAASTTSPLSTLFYEEPVEGSSDQFSFRIPREHGVKLTCPGTCLSRDQIRYCGHPFPLEDVCPNNYSCCLTEMQAFKITLITRKNGTEGYDATSEIRQIFQDGSFGDLNDMICPKTCMLRSNADRCLEEYPDFFCPGNSMCCHEGTSRPLPDQKKCKGQCLPRHLFGYCTSPRRLVEGQGCLRSTACCERPDERAENVRERPQYPFYVEDKDEQYFYVSPEGKLNRMSSLPPDARPLQGEFSPVDRTTGGKIWMIADPQSSAWEQYKLVDPLEARSFFPEEDSISGIPREVEDRPDEFIIPDEEDLTQGQTETPDLTARPPCPGSCLSYFTRFMCFRNYTTYDGFHCPGRSVCCAKLEDVKKHEDYLKSIYPYLQGNFRSFNPNCGKKGRKEESPESLSGEWCWQVAIIDSQNQYVCGGALVENSWVVTSAQCVAGYFGQNQPLFIRAGANDLTSMVDNAVSQTRLVFNTYLHYNYDASTLDNDIALLKLQTPLGLNANVCLACLPSKPSLPQEGTMCTLTGYGFISRDGGMSLKTRETQIPLVHDIDCISNITEALSTVYILPASSFCGGHEKDHCQGAAGNPLVCKVDDYYELTGLVSWSIGCELDETPSIYVKIPALMGWINHVIATDHQLYAEIQNAE